MIQIQPATLQFLEKLATNNNREWFQANKTKYDSAHQNMINFADALLNEMQQHDQIETPSGKKSLHRIYRDIRFSNDKTPYKINFSGSFRRATKHLRGGYYYHIEAEKAFVGGGFWGPNKEDLKLIRDQIAMDDTPLRNVISSTSFKHTFKDLKGEILKTAPKGYPKDHPSIDLLRYKSFIVKHDFTQKDMLADDFYLQMNNAFKEMRRFFDVMTEMLTTDLNGEPLPGY